MTYKDLSSQKSSSPPGTEKLAEPKPAEKQQEAMIPGNASPSEEPAQPQKG